MTSYLVSTCASAMMRLVLVELLRRATVPGENAGANEPTTCARVSVCVKRRDGQRATLLLQDRRSNCQRPDRLAPSLRPGIQPIDFLLRSPLPPLQNRTETELKTSRNGYHHVVIHYFSINLFPLSRHCSRFSKFGRRFPRSRLENRVRNFNDRRWKQKIACQIKMNRLLPPGSLSFRFSRPRDLDGWKKKAIHIQPLTAFSFFLTIST